MGGGFIYKMSNYLNDTFQSELETLKKYKWVDKQTAALFLEFTLYNANLNVFHSCLILYEILPSGSWISSSQFYAVDVNAALNVDLTLLQNIFSIGYLVFCVIFFFLEIKRLLSMGCKYFYVFYNYIEMLILAFTWSAFSMFLYRYYSALQAHTQIKQSILEFINLQVKNIFIY